MTLNIGSALWNGAKAIAEKGNVDDSEKAGVLRGGNACMIGEDEETGQLLVATGSPGGCPRRTYLRFLGIQEVITDDRIHRERMFSNGRKSEESFRERLLAGLPDGYSALCEEDIPTKWETSAGVSVTGRPDLVILDETKTPVKGIENKCISSLWTATKVIFGDATSHVGRPKTDHIVQASHYSWQLGIPFELWYSSGVSFPLPAHYKYIPKKGELRSELIKYWEEGKAAAIEMPEVGYRLKVDEHENVWYQQVSPRGEDWGEWTVSIVNLQRIRNFYEFVARMPTNGVLGPRPESWSADGAKKEYSPCQYCEISSICDKHEAKGLNSWLKAVLKSPLMIDRRPRSNKKG